MSRSNTLFMETTKIGVGKTVSQVQQLLGENGCSAVMTIYDNGEVEAITFKMEICGKDIPFRLPCRWKCIYQNFMERRNMGYRLVHKQDDDEIQAKRVAWRQILRWIEAQLALTRTNMVKVEEVFLPYIQVNMEGQTLFEKFEGAKFKALEHKQSKDSHE